MGFFQKFYYGKAGQADFNPEDLPKNRRELFLAMLKIRFSGLISQNLIYLLFCIPAIFVCGRAFNFLNALAAAMMDDAALQVQFSHDWFTLAMIFLAVMIPCLGIAGVGATGTMYILRNWARDQHAFGFSDIKDSIKANWKQGLAFGLLSGVVNLICFVGWYFYHQQAANAGSMFSSIIMSILEGMMIIIVCIWWMMNMAAYPMMITYDMKFGGLLRNCAIMVVARLPLSMGIWLLSLLPTILFFVAFLLSANMWAMLIWVLFYAVIGFAFNGFLYASYANALFDQYLNPRIAGAPTNMGLRSHEYDDYDDENDDTPVNAQPGYTPAPTNGEAWPPRRPDSAGGSWLDAQAERSIEAEKASAQAKAKSADAPAPTADAAASDAEDRKV